MQVLVACCFFSLLLTCANAGSCHCSVPPLPSLDTNTMLVKLQPYLDQLDQEVQSILKLDNLTGGLVLSIVYRNETIWTKGYGLINKSDPSRGAPTAHTGFRIGSITKSFTALLALMLRDSKQLRSLDDDIMEYLPEGFSVINPFETNQRITIRQLMSHMSGLPREVPCENTFVTGCNDSYEEIYRNLASLELIYPSGQQPAYSNLGFALLGRIVENITNEKWEDYIKKMIFDPLGMTTSGNTFTSEDIKKLALGYYPNGTQAAFLELGFVSPAGQTYVSAADLGKFMALIFNNGKTQAGQIVSGETIREWLAPAYKYPDRTGYGFPWELVLTENDCMYALRTKGGAIPGYRANFQMSTEIKTGFISLQSCLGCLSNTFIASAAQKILLEANAILQNQPAPHVPNYMDYVGKYRTNSGSRDLETPGIMTIASQDSGLLLTMAEGLDYNGVLEWREKDSLQITTKSSDVCLSYSLALGNNGCLIRFQRDSRTGKVMSLQAPGQWYGLVWKKLIE